MNTKFNYDDFLECFQIYCDRLFSNLSKGNLYKTFFIVNVDTDKVYIKEAILEIEKKYLKDIYSIISKNTDTIPISLDEVKIQKIIDLILENRNHLVIYIYRFVRKFFLFLRKIPKKLKPTKYKDSNLDDISILQFEYFPDFVRINNESFYPYRMFLRYSDYFQELSTKYHSFSHLKNLKDMQIFEYQEIIKFNIVLSMFFNLFPMNKKIVELLTEKNFSDFLEDKYILVKDESKSYRLYLDKITRLFLLILKRFLLKNTNGKIVNFCPLGDFDFNKFDKYIKDLFHDYRLDLSILTTMNNLKSNFEIPSFLNNLYYLGIPYHTIQEDFIKRIKTNNELYNKHVVLRKRPNFKGPKNIESQFKNDNNYDEEKILRKLTKNITRELEENKNELISKEIAINVCDNVIVEHKIQGNLLLLIEWIKYNIRSGARSVPTALDYLSGFGKLFLKIFKDNALENLDPEEISELLVQLFYFYLFTTYLQNTSFNSNLLNEDYDYEKIEKAILENYEKIPVYVDKIKVKIDSFIEFLRDEKKIKINKLSEQSSISGNKSTRTSIVTPKEISIFSEKLKDKYRDKSYKYLIPLYLAFWAGLRRSEILSLKKSNFRIGVQTVLYVYESKSLSGIRKIYLDYLMPSGVLKELVSFVTKLSDDDTLFKKDDYSVIIDVLVYALRRFFNDDTIVFHSLRHSFINWTFLKYLTIAYPDFSKFLDEFFDTKDAFGLDLVDSKKFSLYFDLGEDRANTAFLWKLSKTVGHFFPEVTITNYLHTLDLFLIYKNSKSMSDKEFYFTKKQLVQILPDVNSQISVKKSKFLKFTRNKGYSLDDILIYLCKKAKC